MEQKTKNTLKARRSSHCNMSTTSRSSHEGIRQYYVAKIDEKEIILRDRIENLRRLQAQRNELNSRGKESY
jgi:26S proteasome regulatory subunit T6